MLPERQRLPGAPTERYLACMRHRFGALPVRTSALVAVCLLALVLAGRLISGPSSTLPSRPSPTTIAAAPVTPAFGGEPRVLVPPTRIEGPEGCASAEAAEEAAYVADEEAGDLHGGEVSAAVEFRPVVDVVVGVGHSAEEVVGTEGGLPLGCGCGGG